MDDSFWVATTKGKTFSLLEPQRTTVEISHPLCGLVHIVLYHQSSHWVLQGRKDYRGHFFPIAEGTGYNNLPSIYEAGNKRLDVFSKL
jgi:hypothetical protein